MRWICEYITRFTCLRKPTGVGVGRREERHQFYFRFLIYGETVVEEMAISWHVMSLIRILIVIISLPNINRYVQKSVLKNSVKSDSWLCCLYSNIGSNVKLKFRYGLKQMIINIHYLTIEVFVNNFYILIIWKQTITKLFV